MPATTLFPPKETSQKPALLYQGALNEGRGVEQMLEAMQYLDGFELWLAGEGDLSAALRQKAADLNIEERVRFWGYVKPEELKNLTQKAWLGLNVLENKGLSYYYSLANKFFDYVQAELPSLNMHFPEYSAMNAQFEVALLLENLSAEAIVAAVQNLRQNPDLYKHLQAQAKKARQEWVWEKEEKHLVEYWQAVFH